MATMVSIGDEAKARADQFIRSGKYTSFDEVVLAAIRETGDGWIDQEIDLEDLTPEVRTAVEEGLADIDAGRVHDAEEVFAELRERYRNWAA